MFLFDRGHAIGRCPITNRFEVLVFMTWSMVLIYLVIGSSYRLSLMGAFTAPVASVLLFFAVALAPSRTGGQKNQSQPLAGGAYFVFDGGLRGVRAGMYRRRDVSGSGAAVENPPPELDFLPASADHGVVGRKFTFVVAGLHPLHGWARNGIFDWRPDQLGAGGMVYPGLVRLRRHHRRPDAARHGGQVGCDPVDRRI